LVLLGSIENHQPADGAYQAGDASEIWGERINRSFALDKQNIVHTTEGRVGILLSEAPFGHWLSPDFYSD
jgi:hypothetical protein